MIRVYLLLICLLLPACGGVDVPNPFSPSQASVDDVYFDYFQDVPILKDLAVDPERTLISVAQDGSKIGLLTAEGRVDMRSLSNAMINIMSKQGWSLRSSMQGVKNVQIYEKNNRYAVLYYYEQMTSTAMEVWVGGKIAEGAHMPVAPALNTNVMPSNTNTEDILMNDPAVYPPLGAEEFGDEEPLQ